MQFLWYKKVVGQLIHLLDVIKKTLWAITFSSVNYWFSLALNHFKFPIGGTKQNKTKKFLRLTRFVIFWKLFKWIIAMISLRTDFAAFFLFLDAPFRPYPWKYILSYGFLADKSMCMSVEKRLLWQLSDFVQGLKTMLSLYKVDNFVSKMDKNVVEILEFTWISGIMPGIVVFKRRWSMGSDDMFVPAMFLVFLHFVW